MNALAIIGFVFIFLIALYITFATVCVVWGSVAGFYEVQYPLAWCIPAALVWLFVWWINPFTLSIGVAT